eukprot:1476372-Pyramimonas_sp.AAC.1
MASSRPFYTVVPGMRGSGRDPRLQVLHGVGSLVAVQGGSVSHVAPLEADPEPGHPPVLREPPEV